MKQIEFFLHVCEKDGGNAKYGIEALMAAAQGGQRNTTVVEKIKLPASQDKDFVIRVAKTTYNKIGFTIGFEKNPWCSAYYAVKASASPQIPFLPLVKIKLYATAIAKPFGGSIGPWYGKAWANGQFHSDEIQRLDKNIPLKDIQQGQQLLPKDCLSVLPNFSRFIGDSDDSKGSGLADPLYVAFYHDALLTQNQSEQKILSTRSTNDWPEITNWLKTQDFMASDYDPLAKPMPDEKNIRSLEISAIAPNQHDLAYYSIDPDFYNNYYLKMLKGLPKFANPVDVKYIKPDYGYKDVNAPFSVLDQLRITNNVTKQMTPILSGVRAAVNKPLPFIPNNVSSLLTGWTFMNYVDEDRFKKFPFDENATEGGISDPAIPTMFGRCFDSDEANKNYESLTTKKNLAGALPSTPGNCVTGGRTGYSVKIVSPDTINGSQGDIGGAGTAGGRILNPLPKSFYNF